jgi:hypothetical protein
MLNIKDKLRRCQRQIGAILTKAVYNSNHLLRGLCDNIESVWQLSTKLIFGLTIKHKCSTLSIVSSQKQKQLTIWVPVSA